MTNREILEAQSQSVVIGNDLIQKSRYELTKQEQKIVLFMVSKIKPQDTHDSEYLFSFEEFEKVCNLNKDGGFYQKSIREALVKLKTKPLVIPIDGKKTLISSWFNEAVIDEDNNTFRISYSKYLIPYLFRLQAFYTTFTLDNVIPMKSKYSIRLYEYLKSIYYKGRKQKVSLEELKERTESLNYTNYKDFRKRVLEPAVNEINTYTDITIEYKEIKTGRTITDLEIIFLLTNTAAATAARLKALGVFEE